MFEYQSTSYVASLNLPKRLILDEKLIIQPLSKEEANAVSADLRGEPFLMASISCAVICQFEKTDLTHVLIEGRKISEKVISFLKLYGGGAPQIVAHRYKVLSDKSYNPAEDFGGKILPHNHERYWGELLKISEAEFKEIKNYWSDYQARFSIIKTRLNLAFQRFLNYTVKTIAEDRIMDLVMGFEILTGASGSKMAMRAACFLHKDKNNRKEAFNFLKDCYELRSQIIHSGKIESKTLKKLGFEKFWDVGTKLEFVLRKMLFKIIFEVKRLPSAEELETYFWN